MGINYNLNRTKSTHLCQRIVRSSVPNKHFNTKATFKEMNLSILAVLLLLAGANACGPTNPALDLSKAFKFLGFPTPTMFFPKGSPCTIPNQPGVTDCVNGSTGWDIFLSFCGNMHAVSP